MISKFGITDCHLHISSNATSCNAEGMSHFVSFLHFFSFLITGATVSGWKGVRTCPNMTLVVEWGASLIKTLHLTLTQCFSLTKGLFHSVIFTVRFGLTISIIINLWK